MTTHLQASTLADTRDGHAETEPEAPRLDAPPEAPQREVALDWLRGVAILFLVVNHLQSPTLLRHITVERFGIFTGAGLFVLLAGVVLGLVNRRRVEREGLRASVRRLWSRAWLLYRVTLSAAILVWLLTLIPRLDTGAVSTWVGKDGFARQLYPPNDQPLQLIVDLLTLDAGPWQLDVLGLYVMLLAVVAPLGIAALRRRLGFVVLGLSAIAWAVLRGDPPVLINTHSEGPFPIVLWQFLFLIGLTTGWHWSTVRALLLDRRVMAVTGMLAFAGLVLALGSPMQSIPIRARILPIVPESLYFEQWQTLFIRRELGVVRIVSLLAFCAFAYPVLTKLAARGRLPLANLLPLLGRSTLYIFLVHVALMLLASWVPLPVEEGPVRVLAATAVSIGVVAAVIVLVRRQVLFRWIPR